MKVYLDYSNYNRDLKLWIVDDKSERRKLLNYDYKNEKWISTDIEEGVLGLEPSLNLPGRMGEEVMQAIVEAFNERGIKPESGNKTEGKLEATEKHLEDLRMLLKLRKP